MRKVVFLSVVTALFFLSGCASGGLRGADPEPNQAEGGSFCSISCAGCELHECEDNGCVIDDKVCVSPTFSFCQDRKTESACRDTGCIWEEGRDICYHKSVFCSESKTEAACEQLGCSWDGGTERCLSSIFTSCHLATNVENCASLYNCMWYEGNEQCLSPLGIGCSPQNTQEKCENNFYCLWNRNECIIDRSVFHYTAYLNPNVVLLNLFCRDLDENACSNVHFPGTCYWTGKYCRGM